MRFLLLLALWALPLSAASAVVNLARQPVNPLAQDGKVRVLVFARTDCPITQRYAPELNRISREFAQQAVEFWMVFPDRTETPENVRTVVSEYRFPGTPLLDPKQELVREAHATVAPEAAVFDSNGALLYHGRIDDLYVDIGKSRAAAQKHDLEDAIHAALDHKPIREAETRAVGCSLADIE